MSNPTSNFNWQMPTNTDLVTDLPADFEVFGQAVDSTMADLKGGTTGQILSKATNADMDFTWIANDQGDITAVNVTSPITGGGTSGAVTVGIQSASTSQSGAVQLSDSTSTTSSVLAATPTAVKSAYDLANAAVSKLGNFAAGKNKVINGDFGVWQRGTTFTNPSFADYTADRFRNLNYDVAPTTYSITRETFTPGAAPVAGYEGQYFFRSTLTTIGSCTIYDTCSQRIEGVLASNTAITISFWAKSDSNRTQNFYMYQNYGSGGSGETALTTTPVSFSTTTSWQRFTFAATTINNTGKTIGTNAYAYFFLRQAAASGSILDVWGVQVEYGSSVSAFQTASGTFAGELALCQRYFSQLNISNNNTAPYAFGFFFSTTSARYLLVTPVTMRATPTLGGTTGSIAIKGGATSLAPSTFSLTLVAAGAQVISAVVGGVTDQAIIASINTTITLSAEL